MRLEGSEAIKAGWQTVELRHLLTDARKGRIPVYSPSRSELLVYGQSCTRPDSSVDLTRARFHAEGSVEAAAPERLRQGDIVVNSLGRGTLGRSALIGQLDAECVADGNISILRCDRARLLPEYLAYLLSTTASYTFMNECVAQGATNQTSFGLTRLLQSYVTLPDLITQRQVVRYLDEGTAALRDLSEELERLKRFSQERLSALRQDLLLGPDGLGGEHWERGRLKRFVQVTRGRFTHRPRNDPAFYDGEYPFLQTGDIARAQGDVIREWSQTLNERGLSVSRLVPAGTLVMAIAANIGDVAMLGFDACFPDSVVALSPSDRVRPGYLLELIRALRQELLGASTLNTQLNINTERIGGIIVAIPPVDEQDQLIELLRESASDVDGVIGEADTQLRLIGEWREALITHALTQGIDGLPGVA